MLQFFGRSDSVEAIKQSVRDLEKIKVFGPSDLVILDLKRILKDRIAELEREQLSSAEPTQGVAAD